MSFFEDFKLKDKEQQDSEKDKDVKKLNESNRIGSRATELANMDELMGGQLKNQEV